MSLTIDNNRLAQQQALPVQTAQTQTAAAPAAPTSTNSATANPAAALISGNAGLTSDLLSVLLQEQSGASASSSGPGVTLAGMLDAQAQAQTEQNQQDGITGLDPSMAAQSATSTGSVMSGLQDLLDQLSL